ncbi:unnamed protein product [Cunninghamella echinulata]
MAFSFGAPGLNTTNHSAAGTLFGSTPTSTAGFGTTNSSTPSAAGTLFSSSNNLATSSTNSGFGFGGGGTTATNTTGFGGFGQQQQQQQKPATTGFGGFGTSTAPTAPTTSAATGFGGFNRVQPLQTNTGFGTSAAPTTSTITTGFGGFGQQQQQQQQPNSGFGGFGTSTAPTTSLAPTAASGFGFGNTQTAKPTTTTGFGGFGQQQQQQQQQTTGFGGFGQQPSATANTGFGGFGQQQQPQQQQTTGFGGFGQNKLNQPTAGFSGFGQPSLNQNQQLQQQQQQQLQQQQQQQQNVWQQLALIRAHWDPTSPLCQFRHYFYNMVPPNEVHLYVRPSTQDEQLWNEAQKNNPDPTCMVPVLAVGFDDILKRMEIQDQQSELHKNKLEEISQRLETVQRNYELGSQARLEEHKRRHIDLTQRLIRLLRLVQTLRYKGFPLNDGEMALQKNFQELASQSNSPDQLFNKMLHLWSQLQSIKKARLQALGQYDENTLCTWETLNENDTNRIAKVLADEQQGLSHVINILKKDMEDVETLEANLKLKANNSKSFILSSK